MALIPMEYEGGVGEPITITAGSKVTINKQACYRVDKIICISVKFTTKAAVSTNDILLENIPNPATNAYAMLGNGYNSAAYGCRTGNTKIYANGAIPNGTECDLSFSYTEYY